MSRNKKEVVVESSLDRVQEAAVEKLEKASQPMNAPTLQLVRRGRAPNPEGALRRCLIFISEANKWTEQFEEGNEMEINKNYQIDSSGKICKFISQGLM